MPMHPGQLDDQAMLSGMDAMLGGAPAGPPGMGGPPAGATELPSNEGDVVAALVMENVQLRALLGLGPDDPVPMPEGGPPVAPPAPGGLGGPPGF